jgi:hypothetical protein
MDLQRSAKVLTEERKWRRAAGEGELYECSRGNRRVEQYYLVER